MVILQLILITELKNYKNVIFNANHVLKKIFAFLVLKVRIELYNPLNVNANLDFMMLCPKILIVSNVLYTANFVIKKIFVHNVKLNYFVKSMYTLVNVNANKVIKKSKVKMYVNNVINIMLIDILFFQKVQFKMKNIIFVKT